jgi:ubiquinone/menaquinone biosynthesis C-methylase UbiE
MASTRDSYVPALAFDRLTPLFDPVVRLTTRERTFKRRLLDQAAIAPGDRVLDLGCGTGTLALMAKRRDPAILGRARAKAGEAGLEIGLDEGLADELPCPDGSFDKVLSTLLFHHLARDVKEGAAREIARVLRPGGELHVVDWGPPPDPVARVQFLFVQAFDGFEPTRDNIAGRLPAFFTAAGLRDVRERSRLRVTFGSLSLYSGVRGTPVEAPG